VEAVIRSVEFIIQWRCVWICLVGRLPQRSFVYLVSVYVLDPNLPPVVPPLIHFDNGVLGIVGNYFGGLFSALSFDFPSHMRSPLVRPRLRLSLAIAYHAFELRQHAIEYVTCIPTSGFSRCASDPRVAMLKTPTSGPLIPQHSPSSRTSLLARPVPTAAVNGCSKQPHYSITSSARESSAGGTVRPIAFAVLRLMTRSNIVGCSMGRSAGCAPFKILSTSEAARRIISE